MSSHRWSEQTVGQSLFKLARTDYDHTIHGLLHDTDFMLLPRWLNTIQASLLPNSYVADSKLSRNHFYSEKYKTQLFKLHFLQNVHLVQLRTSASDHEGVRNIPGNHFAKAFSALPSHSQWCLQHHKSAVASMLISVEGTGKIQLQPGQENMGDAPVSSLFFALKKSLNKTERCGETNCWFSIFRDVSFWPHP